MRKEKSHIGIKLSLVVVDIDIYSEQERDMSRTVTRNNYVTFTHEVLVLFVQIVLDFNLIFRFLYHDQITCIYFTTRVKFERICFRSINKRIHKINHCCYEFITRYVYVKNIFNAFLHFDKISSALKQVPH